MLDAYRPPPEVSKKLSRFIAAVGCTSPSTELEGQVKRLARDKEWNRVFATSIHTHISYLHHALTSTLLDSYEATRVLHDMVDGLPASVKEIFPGSYATPFYSVRDGFSIRLPGAGKKPDGNPYSIPLWMVSILYPLEVDRNGELSEILTSRWSKVRRCFQTALPSFEDRWNLLIKNQKISTSFPTFEVSAFSSSILSSFMGYMLTKEEMLDTSGHPLGARFTITDRTLLTLFYFYRLDRSVVLINHETFRYLSSGLAVLINSRTPQKVLHIIESTTSKHGSPVDMVRCYEEERNR